MNNVFQGRRREPLLVEILAHLLELGAILGRQVGRRLDPSRAERDGRPGNGVVLYSHSRAPFCHA